MRVFGFGALGGALGGAASHWRNRAQTALGWLSGSTAGQPPPAEDPEDAERRFFSESLTTPSVRPKGKLPPKVEKTWIKTEQVIARQALWRERARRIGLIFVAARKAVALVLLLVLAAACIAVTFVGVRQLLTLEPHEALAPWLSLAGAGVGALSATGVLGVKLLRVLHDLDKSKPTHRQDDD